MSHPVRSAPQPPAVRRAALFVTIALMMAASFALFTTPTFGDDDPRDLSRLIDAEISSVHARDNIAPAPPASDAELLRRLSLDLLGRIPTADEARRFLDDDAPDKRARLIDTMLAHPELPVWWSRVVHNWLNGSLAEPPFGADDFIAFVEQALRDRRPWNDVARDLLLPDPEDPVRRHAAWFLTSRYRGADKREQLDNVTTAVASGLFGVQLQCARCHDHPFVDAWKQDHFYGLAAFLARTEPVKVGNAQALSERADGEVTFVTTKLEEKTARPMFLDAHAPDEPPAAKGDDAYLVVKKDGRPAVPKFSRRRALVEHALRAESPYFRQATVNRVWKQLMGRGLVEPVDQIHDANPASHPKLFSELSERFAAQGFDLRGLIEAIVRSEAYQRSSRRTGRGERPADETYAAALLKPLSPDQWATSLSFATGHFDAYRERLEREKEKRKLDDVTVPLVRRQWEKERDYAQIAERFKCDAATFQVSVTQPLFLAHNGVVRKMLDPSPGQLAAALLKRPDDELLETLWLATLSRRPAEEERQAAAAHLSETKPRDAALRDLFRALLSGEEFRFAP